MKAVILAAGRGSRVAALADQKPKSLIEVCGLPVIERVILAARDGGIRDFVIVTGFGKDVIPSVLGDGRRLGVSIEYVHNDRWDDLANGYSIYVAREHLGERFVILMSDHVFDPRMLRALLAADLPENGCVLLTDTNVENDAGLIDMEDATKVQTDGAGRIIRMGKALTDFDRIDTGLFLSTQGLCDALGRAMERGESSLTAANNELTGNGLMRECAISSIEMSWFDLDTPASFRTYITHLRRSLTKSHDGVVSRYLNRPISSRLSMILAPTPLTPNAVSWILLAAGIAVAPLLAAGHWISGAIAVHLISVLDGVDGEIARLKHQSSVFGAWLDWIADRVVDLGFLAGIGAGAAAVAPDTAPLLAAGAIVASMIYWYTQDMIVITGKMRVPSRRPSGLILNFRRDIFLGIVALALLLGLPEAALGLTILTRGGYSIARMVRG